MLFPVVIYIDDVVVHSSSWEEHLTPLRQLFERLREAGLVVNLPKCEFGKGQVTYLGHHVGQGKVMPRRAKVEAILDLPQPKSRQEVMRVLGMSGLYRFVSNFAAVTELLTNLLKKEAKFVWTEACDRTFQGVKAILACEPGSLAPNFDDHSNLQWMPVTLVWELYCYRLMLPELTDQLHTTRKS